MEDFFSSPFSHPKQRCFGVTNGRNIFNPCNAMPSKLLWDLKINKKSFIKFFFNPWSIFGRLQSKSIT